MSVSSSTSCTEPAATGTPSTGDGGFRRLRLHIAYDGTDFHGWARQAGTDLRTVQSVLEDNLSLVLRTPISLTVAGRTDAGVHASDQVAHCDVPLASLQTRSIAGDPTTLVRRLARLLPPDIALRSCNFAPEGFDARFSALRRHYRYRITTCPSGPMPTRARDTGHWPKPVELARLQLAAASLIGLNDFAAFCKARPHATTIRDLQRFEWFDVSTAEEPDTYEAHVTADAFCWNMVRALVGTCLMTGDGRRGNDFTTELLGQTERSSKVPLAAACGLTLVGVDYPEDTQLAARAQETRGLRTLPDQPH